MRVIHSEFNTDCPWKFHVETCEEWNNKTHVEGSTMAYGFIGVADRTARNLWKINYLNDSVVELSKTRKHFDNQNLSSLNGPALAVILRGGYAPWRGVSIEEASARSEAGVSLETRHAYWSRANERSQYLQVEYPFPALYKYGEEFKFLWRLEVTMLMRETKSCSFSSLLQWVTVNVTQNALLSMTNTNLIITNLNLQI